MYFQVHYLVYLLLKLVARLLFESIRSPSFTLQYLFDFFCPIRKKRKENKEGAKGSRSTRSGIPSSEFLYQGLCERHNFKDFVLLFQSAQSAPNKPAYRPLELILANEQALLKVVRSLLRSFYSLEG